MKNIKYLSLLFVGLLVAACGDPELRFQSFDETEHGAFARRLALSGAFVFNDPAGSNFNGTVEFYDENNGNDVASYTFTVEFRALGGGNGGTDIPAVSFLSIPSSSFVVNADGLPGATFSLNMQAAMDALGLTVADITGGDQFRFDATITMTDGRTFGRANTGPNVISQPPFVALTRIDANIVCTSDIGGAYTYSTTAMEFGGGGGTSQGACAGTVTGTGALTDQGGGIYGIPDMSFGMFGFCWSDSDAVSSNSAMVDVCNRMSFSGVDQYGDAYTLSNGSASGSDFTFDWINAWGDRGTTTITRTDGANWPALTD